MFVYIVILAILLLVVIYQTDVGWRRPAARQDLLTAWGAWLVLASFLVALMKVHG